MSAEKLAALVEQLDRLTPEVSEWMQRGFAAWQTGTDLDEALNLRRGRGHRFPETLARQARRNELLRAAWEAVPEQKPWRKSLALAAKIRRLEPSYRRYKTGYPLASEINRILCAARDNGPLPESANQVHTIVTATPR